MLRNGKVRECSIVALGADPDTNAIFFGAGTRARDVAIARLFAEIGEPVPEDGERSAYRTMSAPEFALVSETIRRLRARVSREQLAFDGSFGAEHLRRSPSPSLSLSVDARPHKAVRLSASDIYARRAAHTKH